VPAILQPRQVAVRRSHCDSSPGFSQYKPPGKKIKREEREITKEKTKDVKEQGRRERKKERSKQTNNKVEKEIGKKAGKEEESRGRK
jgi:hypothetical protein